MTKNLVLVLDNLDDLDSLATLPLNKLAILRAAAQAALEARDTIDDWFSPAWREAHKEAILACTGANDEMERLAKDPKTRHGDWRTPYDVELMVLGYI
jgi:hypothetical protein